MQREKIFGVNPVAEAMKAGRPIRRLLIAEKRHADRDVQTILRIAKERGVEVKIATRDELNREVPQAQHQGIIAITVATEYARLDTLLQIPLQREEIPFFIILDGVEDPRNLGAILRTAEAAGVHGVVVPERRAAGLTETVAKTAAGALEYVPVAKVVNIVNTLEAFKKSGIWIVGAEAGSDLAYWDADFACPIAVVLGGEDKGIRRLVRDHCDYVVSLPLKGKINSLNVSVAAGILLYEILRQRRAKK